MHGLRNAMSVSNAANIADSSIDSSTLANHTVEEIIAPYLQVSSDYQKWSEEEITWDQYATEVLFRENVMSKLRDKYNRHEILETNEFFTDFLANLHFENYCFKSLKNVQTKETLFTCERSVIWQFPLGLEIKVEQKKEILGFRKDSVYTKTRKLMNKRLEMNNLDKVVFCFIIFEELR